MDVNVTTVDGLVDNVVVSMMEDSDNNIWFGSNGATKYDGAAFTSFTKEDGFTNSDVNSISQASDGRIWFGTRGALFHYDGETFVDFTKKHGLNIRSYIPTLIDRRGHLWFGGDNGLYHYDGEQLQQVFEPDCFSLFEDSHGNIWFSGGAIQGQDGKPDTSVLNRFDPANGLEKIVAAKKQIKVESGLVFRLTEDEDGDIWFGSLRGIGRINGDAVQYY
jgi:ligand-binding sensor domain-containing protein